MTMRLLQCISPVVAHRFISRAPKHFVAFGPKQTLSSPLASRICEYTPQRSCRTEPAAITTTPSKIKSRRLDRSHFISRATGLPDSVMVKRVSETAQASRRTITP